MYSDILPFWQEIGTSASIISKRVSEKLKIKTSHTGTLDPLATGVVLIILGDKSQNKEMYIQEKKEYEFEIIFGFNTDTHDGMGVIEEINTESDIEKLDINEIKKVIMSFQGKISQRYPDFSSKKISGKSLWEYKRLGALVPKVYIEGEIYEIEMLRHEFILSSQVISSLKYQISKVKGNFRQSEILQNYNSAKFPDKFLSIKLRVVMSRGLYVRGLVRDICSKLDSAGIVFNLIRTKDGIYSQKECQILSNYFSKELEKDSEFLSPNFLNL